MARNAAVIGLLVMSSASAFAKSGRTYYTDERIAVGRENVATYEWAKALRKRILETGDEIKYYIGTTYTAANKFVKQSDEFLWLLQPSTEIPRTYYRGRRTRCPKCGDAVKKINPWNCWRIEPIGHPYQVQCRMCKRWYPSNAYHKGDRTSGDYPDDGSGWEHDGRTYYFLREYAHMCYGTVVIPSLRSLSQAWLLTGDRRYAHKCCVLLARLATQYPNYGWEGVRLVGKDVSKLENRFDRTYLGPWDGHDPYYSWKTGGMITDLIWETFCFEAIVYAYDAVYDFMATDEELLAFVRAQGMPVKTVEDLRDYIETYILRAGMNGLLSGAICGNMGFHQAAALAVALVIDDHSENRPNTKTMVEYAYHGAGQSAYVLVNGLTRDGGGHESPNYNRIKCDFIRVAKLMEEIRRRHPKAYPRQRYPDIFAHPKARGLFNYYIEIPLNDTMYPSIGDCGGIRAPMRYEAKHRKWSMLKEENLFAFRKYGDPRYARAATAIDGEPYGGELWEPYPAEAIQAALKKPTSTIVRKTRQLDGYGLAILESGTWPSVRAATLNYCSLIGHRQHDHLSLQLHARGLSLLPDLGYPKTWDYRWRWDSNSLAHNTVTVNETQPVYRSFRNHASLFAAAEGVHVVTAHHNPYPERMGLGRKGAAPVDLYERTVLLVDVDETRFYVVDVFAVRGGEQHDQSWHAMLVKPEPPALDWRVQEKGTLAGPNVPMFGAYTDRWGRKKEKGDFPSFVGDIRRATLTAPARWIWKSGLPEGDTLHLHVVPTGNSVEVIMARGRSPAWPEEELLDFLLVRRGASEGSPTHFVTVLDAFQGKPVVRSVRQTAASPIVLEIERADGVDEVTVHVPPGPSRTTQHRPLGVRVRSIRGVPKRDVRIGTVPGVDASGYVAGTIRAVDRDANQIVVEPTGPRADAAEGIRPGLSIRIFNDLTSSMYRIEGVRVDGERLRITLDRTALVARFPLKAIEEGRLVLGADSPFITGHVDKETGELTDGPNDYYHGLHVKGQGLDGVIRGISNTKPPRLYLMRGEEAVRRAPDLAAVVGTVVSVWRYGAGDHIEVARVVP